LTQPVFLGVQNERIPAWFQSFRVSIASRTCLTLDHIAMAAEQPTILSDQFSLTRPFEYGLTPAIWNDRHFKPFRALIGQFLSSKACASASGYPARRMAEST
jgi:hypothetical protein